LLNLNATPQRLTAAGEVWDFGGTLSRSSGGTNSEKVLGYDLSYKGWGQFMEVVSQCRKKAELRDTTTGERSEGKARRAIDEREIPGVTQRVQRLN